LQKAARPNPTTFANYFREIRAAYRLHTANVEVRPSERGTAPIQVVDYARDLFANGDPHKGIQPPAFEQVDAVFDRDNHGSYLDALRLAASLDGKLRSDNRQVVTFKAIASVPSFELWLLLHYEHVKAPLHRDEVMQALEVCFGLASQSNPESHLRIWVTRARAVSSLRCSAATTSSAST